MKYIFFLAFVFVGHQMNAQKLAKQVLKCRERCTLLRNCDPCLEMLRNKNRAARSMIKDLKCGRENLWVKVCCPDPKPEITSYFPDDCGQNPVAAGNIINGEETMMGEFPWAAAMGYEHSEKKSISFMCSGTLINARYVLTAAHCLDPKRIPEGYKLSVIRLGDWNLNTKKDCYKTQTGEYCAPPYIAAKIEQKIQHPLYDNGTELANDIALLRLDRTINFSEKNGYILPICLPSFGVNTRLLGKGRDLQVIGWGITDIDNPDVSSPIILKAKLQFANESLCSKYYFSNFGESQLCVGGTTSDSCLGDSGGPLMLSNVDGPPYLQVGIISFGKSCGIIGIPAIYTEVSAYKGWIESNLEPWE